MRHQPRDNNNPANPLFKVAALEIKRVNERVGKQRSCFVAATLNFKKSSDLRGHTQDESGRGITVNFTLAIKRATFEMRFAFDDPKDLNHLSVTKVAFVDGLTAPRS